MRKSEAPTRLSLSTDGWRCLETRNDLKKPRTAGVHVSNQLSLLLAASTLAHPFALPHIGDDAVAREKPRSA